MPGEKDIPFPGIPAVTDGAGAVAWCERKASDSVCGASSVSALRMQSLYGHKAGQVRGGSRRRPLLVMTPENEDEVASLLAGLAMTGLRAAGFVSGAGVLQGRQSLIELAGRHLPALLHVACRTASGASSGLLTGHASYHAMADAGLFQLFAKDAQEAADFSLIAHRIAELALIAGMVAQDGFVTTHSMSSLLLPEPELVAGYLGAPEDLIESPTPAQRIVFGATRRRIPEQWSVDNPIASGAPQGGEAFAQAVAAQRPYFAGHLPELADAAFGEYFRLTGRSYGRVGAYRTHDAHYLIVAQGSLVPLAEAAADYLRSKSRTKVGVVNITMLRPFPGDLLGRLLLGRQGVAVLERLDHPQAEDGPLMRELRSVVTKCLENGGAKRGDPPFPGYTAYRRTAHAPALYAGAYGMGGIEPRPEALIGAIENMLPGGAGRRRTFLSLDFVSSNPRSPKEEIYLEALADAYPAVASLTARGSHNPELLPRGAVSVIMLAPAGRACWSEAEHLGRTLFDLTGGHVVAMPGQPEITHGSPAKLSLVAAPEPIRINSPPRSADVLILADARLLAGSDPLDGLKDEGALILNSPMESDTAVWAALPPRGRQAIHERRIRLYCLDASRIAAEEARDAVQQSRIMGLLLQGAALATPPVQALTGLSGKPLLRAVRESLRHATDGNGDRDPHQDADLVKRGVEESRLLMDLPAEEPPSVREAVGLPAALKEHPVNPVPAMDLHRFWERVGSTYARGLDGANLADPFIATGWIPAASGAFRDFGQTRATYPRWIPETCTGCGECWLLCPDSALPGLVTGIGPLLETLLRRVQARGLAADHLPRAVRTLEAKLRERIASATPDVTIGTHLRDAVQDTLDASKLGAEGMGELEQQLGFLLDALGDLPLAATEPYFTTMEQAGRGDGGLLSITLDPSKCKACMACVAGCPEQALVEEPQDDAALVGLRNNWDLWLHLPTTSSKYIRPAAGLEDAPGLESLLLDKRAYQSLTGGDDSAPGSTEKTVLHLFAATVEGLMQPRIAALLERLDDLMGRVERHIRLNLAVDVEDPEALQRAVDTLRDREFTLSDLSEEVNREHTPVDSDWLRRVTQLLSGLKRFKREYGRDAHSQERSSLGIVHGISNGEAWGTAYPYNPFPFPWAGHEASGSPALAMALFEGHMARMAEGFRTIRMAELELEGRYIAEVHDAYFNRFDWRDFSEEEYLLCPPVVITGGDTALFGAAGADLPALLRSQKPIKVLCLDTQAYGQLAQLTPEHGETALAPEATRPAPLRRDIALAALAHRNAFIAQGGLANPRRLMADFAAGLAAFRPAVFNVYCALLPPHAPSNDMAVRQSRLALESRAHPWFRYDPAAGGDLHECISLAGNPELDADWPTRSLNYLDEEGQPRSMELPMTYADYAVTVPGLEHHFRPVAKESWSEAMRPLAEFLELDEDEQLEAQPYLWAPDAQGGLGRLLVSRDIADACAERQGCWRALRTLTRRDIVPVDEEALSERTRAEMVEKVAQSLVSLAWGGGDAASTLMQMAAPGDGEGKAGQGEPHA